MPVHHRGVPSLDGQNRVIVIAESLARAVPAIRITSAHWLSYLPPTTEIGPHRHRPCVCCVAIGIAPLAFTRITFVPRSIEEWPARVHRGRAIGDFARLRFQKIILPACYEHPQKKKFGKIPTPIKIKLALPPAHKTKIGTSTPPPPSKQKPNPPLKRGILWAWGSSSRKNPKMSGAHKIGAVIFGPRIAGGKFF